MAKFHKSFLIKLPKKVYIYDFVDIININKDKTDYIFQNFLLS